MLDCLPHTEGVRACRTYGLIIVYHTAADIAVGLAVDRAVDLAVDIYRGYFRAPSCEACAGPCRGPPSYAVSIAAVDIAMAMPRHVTGDNAARPRKGQIMYIPLIRRRGLVWVLWASDMVERTHARFCVYKPDVRRDWRST